jgi:prepilin peptidase CpaA
MENYLILGALISAMMGAAQDVRARRIPNWLTYGSLSAGLVLRTYWGGWHGLSRGTEGMLAGGGVLFLFFLARGIGAGDVKLMAAVGAWVGAWPAVLVMVYTAFAGFGIAVFYMLFYGRVGSTLANVGELVRFHLTSGVKPHPEINLEDPAAIRMPYGLAIAVGTLFLFASTAPVFR